MGFKGVRRLESLETFSQIIRQIQEEYINYKTISGNYRQITDKLQTNTTKITN